MALFTDGSISEVQDLIAYEANLMEMADAEGIDLNAKLRLAQSELEVELAAAALRPGNLFWAGPGWASSGAEVNLSRFDLNTVVVTPALKLWHTFQALAISYRDAYNRKLNDKYLPKWNEYKELARWASNLLFQTGIGLALAPIPKPGAPVLDWVSGTLPGGTFYVQMTWVGADGVHEGAPSDEVAIEVPANQALRVTPPAPPGGPYRVAGWKVYAGTASARETGQSGQPLPLGQAWVIPASGLMAGPAAGRGQDPDFFRTVPRFVPRG
jgi:hypothetical protein